jgi:hypothetical protein
LDFEAAKKQLPLSQRIMLEEALSSVINNEDVIDLDSIQNLEAEPPNLVVQEKTKAINYLGKRSASSCTTP